LNQDSIKKHLPLVLGVVLLLIIPLFLQNAYHQLVANRVIVSAIVVLGLNYISGLVGQMNTGIAGMFALGAYTSALLTTGLGISAWFGYLAALVMGLVVGILLGYPTLRISGIYMVITTLAFAEIVRLLLTNMVDFTGGALGIRRIPEPSLFGLVLTRDSVYFYYLLAALLVVSILVARRVIGSKWGRAFKAVRDNPDAAETCGIKISSVKIGAFVLCSVYACVAGAFYGTLMGFISPDEFSVLMTVRFIMMLMVGGIATIGGPVAGAAVVTILPEALRFLGGSYWLFFSFAVLLFALFLPHGVYSIYYLLRDLVGKFTRKAGESPDGKT